MKISSFSRESNIKLVNSLLYLAHIFSAGFSFGLYVGKNTGSIFSGTLSFFALYFAVFQGLMERIFLTRRMRLFLLKQEERQPDKKYSINLPVPYGLKDKTHMTALILSIHCGR
jgi:hypothetical protein